MSSRLEWWGYVHTNGTLHLKRYFDRLDIVEAKESPFVARIIGPFFAQNQTEARKRLKELKVALDIRSIKAQIGTWTAYETKSVAVICMDELSDTDAIEVVRDRAFGDDSFTDELNDMLEKS